MQIKSWHLALLSLLFFIGPMWFYDVATLKDAAKGILVLSLCIMMLRFRKTRKIGAALFMLVPLFFILGISFENNPISDYLIYPLLAISFVHFVRIKTVGEKEKALVLLLWLATTGLIVSFCLIGLFLGSSVLDKDMILSGLFFCSLFSVGPYFFLREYQPE